MHHVVLRIWIGYAFSRMKDIIRLHRLFWTNYEKKDKSYAETIQNVAVNCTDQFTRTNKVLGVGVDIDI